VVSSGTDSGDDGSGSEGTERVIRFRGNLADIRPLSDYGEESTMPEKCSICGGENGNHDLRLHRNARNTEVGKSIGRHPAGKRKREDDK
jgi:hypothetical protein